MRDAAVGFQCPSCIAEGARTTRQGRLAYGGSRSANPALTSQILIALNAAVFLLLAATGGSSSPWLLRLALLPTGRCGLVDGRGYLPSLDQAQCDAAGAALQWFPGVSDGAYWQLLTSAFTHLDLWHIGFNMVALWVLGPQLEMVLGRTRFLAVYLLSALAGSTLVYWASGLDTPTIGASGAIFGLMGALLVVAYKVRANVSQLLVWIGLNFLLTVLGRSFISWQGHLGGFLGGVLIAAVLVYAPRAGRQRWQAAGLGAISVVLLALLVVRTAILA
ncbi:rhomboid family intramembrane serine protease [Nocardioides mesophilus]|nr:rhomboid family intramembrane serine protease [Nocardioides mesophilus]